MNSFDTSRYDSMLVRCLFAVLLIVETIAAIGFVLLRT
jgi:hypothetical protein